MTWPKQMMIHVVTEAIVMIGVVMYMNNKFTKMQAEIKEIQTRVLQSEDMTKRCMMMVQQLYEVVSRGGGGSNKKSVGPNVAQAPAPQQLNEAFQAAQAVQAAQAAQAQLFQQYHLAQMQPPQPPSPLVTSSAPSSSSILKPTTGQNMMESILTILPSMMGPLMSGPSASSMIIAELEKVPPPSQESAAQVEIADDDDPDVNDALDAISSIPSIST